MAELCLFLSTIKEYFSLILTLSDLASEIAMKPKGSAKCNTLDQWRSPLKPYVAKKYFETYENYNNMTRWLSISQKFNKVSRPRVKFRAHSQSGDIHDTFKLHSRYIQVTFTIHSSDIQVTFMIHSGISWNIFKYSGHIGGTIK